MHPIEAVTRCATDPSSLRGSRRSIPFNRARAWLAQEAAGRGGDVRRAAVVDEHDSLAGKSSKEIAAALGVSARTVEGHRRVVLRRMELSSAAALAGLLSRTGA
jgi:FixJ family two-component response regulator